MRLEVQAVNDVISQSILNFPKVHSKQFFGQLQGSSLSLAITEFCFQHAGVKLIIAPDNLTALQLYNEINFFITKEKTKIEALLFPDWETLPYDQFSPFEDIISQRLSILSRLQQVNNAIVIASVNTLMHRICPQQFLHQQVLLLTEGQSLELNQFKLKLQESGYRLVNQVSEHGEYAFRGSILDIYPMGSLNPFRIELFDDEIESLRSFDPDTQRTIDKIKEIVLLPAREVPLHEEGITCFRRNFREQFSVNPIHCSIYETVSEGRAPAGIEYYLPLFFEKTATFFDYLSKDSTVFLVEAIQAKAEQFWEEITIRYEQRSHDILRPILKPNICFLSPTELLTLANQHQTIRCTHNATEKKGAAFNFEINKPPVLTIIRAVKEPFQHLKDYLYKTGKRYLIVVESAGRREVLLDLLKQNKIFPEIVKSWSDFLSHSASLCITTGLLAGGFDSKDPNIGIIVESQLLGESTIPQRKTSQKVIDPDLIVRNLAELQVDAPVVHLTFGVGRYKGLKTLEVDGNSNEFLMLTYADDDRVYVPVTSLHLISRYQGVDSDQVPLHKLGTDRWQKERKKAAEKIHDVAVQLLEIYAKREAQKGHIYNFDFYEYETFVSGFPFTETLDQTHAIEQIIQDMKSERPMDRLICGDVGFGKTEVAMRATFIAVLGGKQVCILAPTTLLARQHYETFRDRFAEFPIQIELLSRARTPKESAQIIESLSAGKIDIIIGTHKLFAKTIQYKNLGLLIVDEEHRFGVKQKEHIKALRTSVDILSMTATPIPRTLNMAIAGLRDISLIATPPAKRLAIKTFWQEKNNMVLREAILREILRGGQVYFVHNKVQTIAMITQELEKLVPEAKIRSAHGQLREKELERIMSDFYHNRFNVLVCTTIIENGIDIPTANTIIIDRADQFGLAQLHQLRGRVGRSHHQAYAYLFTADQKLLNVDAIKRLNALTSLEDLGAGFALATQDMEIRGAGELLGKEQSGNMHAIGFSLYMEMLDKAVQDLKTGKTPELSTAIQQNGPEIDLGLSTIIPEDYLADIHTRLIMYKRIANAKDPKQLDDLQIEMIDRFGLLPPSTKNLFLATTLRMLASQLGILKITLSAEKGVIEFQENPHINLEALVGLIQSSSQEYQMKGTNRLQFVIKEKESFLRIKKIEGLLSTLQIKSS